MDDADIAQYQAEQLELLRRKRNVLTDIPTSDHCLNCFDATPDGKRWCCVSCFNDHQARSKR